MEFISILAVFCLRFLIAETSGSGLLHPELDCPEECECHYFRINWVADCSQSNLSRVPIHQLPLETYILDLSENNIQEIQPLVDGLKLRVLRLGLNEIHEVRKDVFVFLPYLIELDLSINNIIHIENDAFSENQGLIKLDLSGNPINSNEGVLTTSRSILTLNLNNCSLGPESTKNSHLFSGLHGLTKLDLSDNPIKILNEGIFHSLDRLQTLLLNNCRLESISSGALDGLGDLKSLEMRDNPGLQALSGVTLPSLESLDIRRGGFLVPLILPVGGSSLSALYLGGNPGLREGLSFHESISDVFFSSLDTLDLSDSGLSSLLPASSALKEANRMRDLDLSGNPIPSDQLQDLLRPMNRLRRLSLRNCSLSRLPSSECFASLSELRELDLSLNPLGRNLTQLAPLITLTRLDLSHCNITSLPKATFSEMTSLETLNLAGNSLSKLESRLFINLNHLKVLDLSDCGLKRLKSSLFDDDFSYPDLVELRLAGNQLEVDLPDGKSFLPSQIGPSLLLLDLTRCGLERLPDDSLAPFGNLTTLLLQGNRLTAGTDGEGLEFLQYLPLLEELDLTSNKFDSLDPFDLRFSLELKTLRLWDNPWSCGCHVADLWDWALSQRGDLSLLPGSTLSNDEGEPTVKRKRKALTCRFVPGISPVTKMKGWPFETSVTWWKYVKVSDCESSRSRPKAEMLTHSQYQTENEENNEESKDIWWWLLLVSMLGITIAAFLSLKRNVENKLKIYGL